LDSGAPRRRRWTALHLSPRSEKTKIKNKQEKPKTKEKIFVVLESNADPSHLWAISRETPNFVKLMLRCPSSDFTPSTSTTNQPDIMASFIIKQEHSMLTLERDSLMESLSEIDSSNTATLSKSERSKAQKIRDRVNQINNRLKQINSVFETETAKAEADRAAAAELAEKKAEAEAERRARLPPDTFIECRTCKVEFTFSGDDQDRFLQNGWNAPIRCTECRQARKEQRPQQEHQHQHQEQRQELPAISICCKDCTVSFEFSGAQQRKFAKMDFAAPVRCDACRQKKKDSVPKATLINCKDCHVDFTFSVGAQKHFAEMKWAQPSRCGDCRKEAAAKKATTAKKTTGSSK
jgi:hypothetical protein